MEKPAPAYCDAPTVPEMQQTLLDPQLDDTLPVGFVLKGYKLNQVIAQGHCNISYMAQEVALSSGDFSQVVIKEFFPSSLVKRKPTKEIEPIAADKRLQFETGKQRFLKEACFLMACDHPSIVSVENVFTDNGTVYMVMPYEQGKTLFQLLGKKGRMSQQELLDLFFSISEGLSLLHDQGCLHRDLKPSNIFIRETGSPVLLDFSSAIFKEQRSGSCTPMISQGYTPIEQYSTNTSEQGSHTDIYALAAIMYKGITGQPPIDAVERGQKILKELDDPYLPLVSIASGQYSRRFLGAIDHALCFRAEDRPRDITEWCAEFEGRVPVWSAAESVRKNLLTQAAKRSVDFDLYSDQKDPGL